ncbi:hypothetical protein RJT34_27076 [Clitoria ternatea]|uniref:Uncharacterized protein n=1 Tax=Clitoria ternatea TaxID=43366 RepID=A0AAN9F9L6_CLITE
MIQGLPIYECPLFKGLLMLQNCQWRGALGGRFDQRLCRIEFGFAADHRRASHCSGHLLRTSGHPERPDPANQQTSSFARADPGELRRRPASSAASSSSPTQTSPALHNAGRLLPRGPGPLRRPAPASTVASSSADANLRLYLPLPVSSSSVGPLSLPIFFLSLFRHSLCRFTLCSTPSLFS